MVELESYFRGKRKEIHNWLNIGSERNQRWLRGFHQGNCVDSSANNQDTMPRKRDVFWKMEENEFNLGWVEFDKPAGYPDGNVQKAGHRCTVSNLLCLSFLHCKNGWDIAFHFSPRTVERINEAVCTFIPHQGSTRAWKTIRLSPIMVTWKQNWFDMKAIEEGECKPVGPLCRI